MAFGAGFGFLPVRKGQEAVALFVITKAGWASDPYGCL